MTLDWLASKTGNLTWDQFALLADADWGKLIGFAVVIIVYAINYFLGAEGRAKARRPPTPRPFPQDRPQLPPERARQQADDEVAEFLRRAADKRGNRPATPAQAPTAERGPLTSRPQPLSSSPAGPARPGNGQGAPSQVGQSQQRQAQQAAQQRARQAAARQQRSGQPAVDVVPIEEPSQNVGSRRKSVAPSVVPTIAPTIGAHRVGSGVDQADEHMQSHLQQVFDHNLGSLASRGAASSSTTQGDPARQPGTGPLLAPVGFAAMLANADTLRQAVVLQEILKRPVDRW